MVRMRPEPILTLRLMPLKLRQPDFHNCQIPTLPPTVGVSPSGDHTAWSIVPRPKPANGCRLVRF
jgi:hypothetical protein